MKKLGILILLTIFILSLACSPTERITPPVNPVKADLWVMSECPFGLHAETLMSKVKDAMGPAIDLNIHFIVSEGKDETFQSLHGPGEVERNLVQACVGALYPDDQLNFILAWNSKPAADAGAILSFLKLEPEKVRQCALGEQGTNILFNMMQEAKQKKIDSSPTLFLDGKLYEKSRSSMDIADEICLMRKDDPGFVKLCEKRSPVLTYTDANPNGIGNCGPTDGSIDPTRPISGLFKGKKDLKSYQVTVLYFSEENPPIHKELEGMFQNTLPNLQFSEVPYPGKKASQLIEKYRISWLPALVFEEEFAGSTIYQIAKGVFHEIDDSLVMDPILTGANRNISREFTKNTLDVYYSPFDPNNWEALATIAEMVFAPERKNAKTTIRMLPVLPVNKDGNLQPVDKDGDIPECIRQIMVQEKYPEKLTPYFEARYANMEEDWKVVAQKAGIDPEELKVPADDSKYRQQLLENSKGFLSMEVLSTLAFVRNNQELLKVTGRQSLADLLAQTP